MLPVYLVSAALLLAPQQQPQRHEVRILDRKPYYEPAVLSIRAGDTVVWRNDYSTLPHLLSDTGGGWTSPMIPPGRSWRYVFTKRGKFAYLCTNHVYMTGTVNVAPNADAGVGQESLPYAEAFSEFVVPTPKSVPNIITVGPDGSLWFTLGGGGFFGFEEIPPLNKIGRFDPVTHRVTEFATPATGSAPTSITVDSRQTVWFTLRKQNSIGRLSRYGEYREFPIPTPNSVPTGITVDQEDQIWFAEQKGNKIGRLSPDGTFREYDVPGGGEPRTVFADRLGRIWFSLGLGNKLGKLEDDQITLYSLPTPRSRPIGIHDDSRGNIWYVAMIANKLARLSPDGSILEYSIPTPHSAPFKLVVDDDDRVWFTEVYGNKIGVLVGDRILEFEIPTRDSRPGGIVLDAAGKVWFTEQMGNKLGRLDPALLPNLP